MKKKWNRNEVCNQQVECTFQLRKLRRMLYHSFVFSQIIRTLFELFYFFNPLAGNGNPDVGNFILSIFNFLVSEQV